MSLVKCPECESSISSFCGSCPKCGYPISEMDPAKLEPVQLNKNEQSEIKPMEIDTEKPFEQLKNSLAFNKKTIYIGAIFIAVLLIICLGINKTKSSSSSSSSNTSSETAQTSHNSTPSYATLCRLYLDVTDVEIEHTSSYTIATGKVTNTGKEYSLRYIKVKGAFKNKAGETMDTDWTYVVGGEYLAPGESSSFRLSVPRDYNITDCTVTVMTD